MAKEVDPLKYPWFCSVCYCERCHRGLYTDVRTQGMLREDGTFACPQPRCPGVLSTKPALGWKRMKPCVDGCYAIGGRPA